MKKGIKQGSDIDAPGSFIAWLSGPTTVHAYEMPGNDIGSLKSYKAVQETYKGIEIKE